MAENDIISQKVWKEAGGGVNSADYCFGQQVV